MKITWYPESHKHKAMEFEFGLGKPFAVPHYVVAVDRDISLYAAMQEPLTLEDYKESFRATVHVSEEVFQNMSFAVIGWSPKNATPANQ